MTAVSNLLASFTANSQPLLNQPAILQLAQEIDAATSTGQAITPLSITGFDATFSITGWTNPGGGQGGPVTITAGPSSSANGNEVLVQGGAASGASGNGGRIRLIAAAGVTGASANGGAVIVTSGASGSGATGSGGAVTISTGAALSTNGSGGAVTITTGVNTGSGSPGTITFTTPNAVGTGSGGNIALNPGTGTAGQATGQVILGAPVRTFGYTVSALPTAAAYLQGARAHVTDATAPTFLGTLTGGGTVVCPVMCNGVAWVAG